MGTPPVPELPRQVGLLVLEEDPQSGGAIRQILDSEGLRVRIVPDVASLFAELKTAEYSLVIANVGIVGVDTPVFVTLRELCNVPADEGARLRILYLVPEMTGSQYVAALEISHLPYVVRPYHLHDFLEKVSDLLVATGSIEDPIRSMSDFNFGSRAQRERTEAKRAPQNPMFASRDDYQMTEEEMLEWERSEAEAKKKSEEEKKERQQRF